MGDTKNKTIFDYVTTGINSYEQPVDLDDSWSWSMKQHLRRCFLYKNSQFEDANENRDLRPNKNIVLGVVNVHYRTEGFDVKDIELYVNNHKSYYKSFLVKKFHDTWALENEIDTFIDELVESYVDYGGSLVRKTDKSRPEIVDLRSISFGSQIDLLSYPFGIKHTFSESDIRKFKKWGLSQYGATIDLDTFITLATKDEKDEIEVYEVHGHLPSNWLDDNTEAGDSEDKFTPQVQIVAFYQDENNQAQGVTLFKHREPVLPFKFLARDRIVGRALGRSAIEELFDSQIWTNWNEIKTTEMLEAASKMIAITTDPSLASKHPSGMKDMDNLEFLEIAQGSEFRMFDNYPRNLTVFNDSLNRWESHAQTIGSASEGLQGEAPTAGTPFKLFEAQTIEAKGIHKYRQGKIAVFVDGIYRDWIIPYIQKSIATGKTFLSELSADEMIKIGEDIAKNEAGKRLVSKILNGETIEEGERENLMAKVSTEFFHSGNKKFIEILKDEIQEPLEVMTNIAGKQKNLAMLTDKVVNVLRQYLASPELRQDPEMAKLLNVILESSGLSPIMFSPAMQQPQMQQQQPQQRGSEPLKRVGEIGREFDKEQAVFQR